MTCFIIFPMGLIRKMGGLRYVSLFAIGCMAFVLILLISEFPMYKKEFYNKEYVNVASFNYELFNAIGVIYFAYTNQS
jgi:amino acid permease